MPMTNPMQTIEQENIEQKHARLQEQYAKADGDMILQAMIEREFPARICVVSSFGAESAVLLHKVAQIDPTVPIIFLNTGKLFGETLRYRDRLQAQLGLADIRAIAPHKDDLAAADPAGDLWQKSTDKCCYIRKVLPQARALRGFEAVITGRKRFQTHARRSMAYIEMENGAATPIAPTDMTPDIMGRTAGTDEADAAGAVQRIRINPLASHDLPALNAYMEAHKLPRHPLVKDGYLSIGCMPCTDKVAAGGDYRSGRWADEDKEECGIHQPDFVYGDGI